MARVFRAGLQETSTNPDSGRAISGTIDDSSPTGYVSTTVNNLEHRNPGIETNGIYSTGFNGSDSEIEYTRLPAEPLTPQNSFLVSAFIKVLFPAFV